MKFTDGYWQLRPGVGVLRPGTVESVEPDERGFTVFAPTGRITGRGDTLNRPVVTVRHDFDSVPVLARPGAVIPFGAVHDRPDYAWADGVRLRLFAPVEGQRTRVRVPAAGGGAGAEFEVRYVNGTAGVELVAGASSDHVVEVAQ